jgi:hypothetical protein
MARRGPRKAAGRARTSRPARARARAGASRARALAAFQSALNSVFKIARQGVQMAGLSGDLLIFLTDLLIAFGICSLAAGAFTAYFGAGKSRKIGAALLGLGLVVLLLVAMLFLYDIGVDPNVELFADVIFPALVHIIGAAVGAGVALVVFLVAIMKS